MGVSSCANLLWRSKSLSLKMIMHLTKTRFDEVKSKHVNRTHHMIVIDANLISYKTPEGMDAAKCVEFIACSFSSCGMGVLVHAYHPTQQCHTKRESVRRKCEKERTTVKSFENDRGFPYSFRVQKLVTWNHAMLSAKASGRWRTK